MVRLGAKSTILLLVKCEEDMTSHLTSLGVSSKRGRRSIPTLSESNLILNRAGPFGLGLQRTGEMTFFVLKHRQELTVEWAGRKRLWLHGILQKKVPLSYKKVEREASQKNGGFHLTTTLWKHPRETIGLTQCLLSHLCLVYVQP